MGKVTKATDSSHTIGLEAVWSRLARRLTERRGEIEDAVLGRVRTVPVCVSDDDAVYEAGLRSAVEAAVGHALVGITRGEQWRMEPIPEAVVAQARRAAHYRIGPEMLLLRCMTGHQLFKSFVMEEALRGGFSSDFLCVLQRIQDAMLERLATATTSEYKRALDEVGRSAVQRRKERVQALLAHRRVDPAEFEYEFDGRWHIGMVAVGSSVERCLGLLAERLGRHLLVVPCGENTVWAWLGGRGMVTTSDVENLVSADGADELSLAIGASRHGLDGWRLTHREAQTAFSVALKRRQSMTRCSDVILEAALLKQEVVMRSLMDHFLTPLNGLRDGGVAARTTLHAYFGSRRNASLAAKKLHVTRQTIDNRLRVVEECLGRPLHTCYAELEVALRIDGLQPAEHVPAVRARRPKRMIAATGGARDVKPECLAEYA